MTQSWMIPPEIEREMTPAVRAFFEAMRQSWEAERKGLLARIEELEQKVDGLQQELKKDKRFRHPPKSSDTAAAPASSGPPAESPGKQPQRRRGGQPGHPKAERALIPSEKCNRVVICKPDCCRNCAASLDGEDPEPLRHQVTDIPPIVPEVVEYQLHRLDCHRCGVSTCGVLPEGVPTGMTGPRLVAIVGVLMVLFRQSKRRVSLCCENLFGVSISPGLVVKLQNIVTESAKPAYDHLVSQLPHQPAVNVDETPTRERNGNAWIWTVVAAQFTVFAVRLTKAACVIRNLLGESYSGVVTSDRAKMYDFFTVHQWCWAHLKRDFESLAESASGRARQVAQQLLVHTNTLFHHWHRVRDGTIQRGTFQRHLRPLYGQIYLTLEEGTLCPHRQTAAMCQNLLDRYDNLFEFARHPIGLVEPTNNAAERALRHPVIWKQLSFGTQSAAGSRFVETLLTITETCRQQRRDTLQFLVDAVDARFHKRPAPLLTSDGV